MPGYRFGAGRIDVLENEVDIGPFSHLRPGAHLESGVHIGNFAEVKNSRLAAGVKMGHFGYVGDATVGAGGEPGRRTWSPATTMVKEKHPTVIEAGAFYRL